MLARYEPWGMLNQFQKDLEQAFQRFNHQVSNEDGSSVATSAWVPAVDIREEGNQFVIEADIPGVDPKDIEVSMADGVLTLKGERKQEEQKEDQQGYRRFERLHGVFYRRFSLPDTADADNVSAVGKNGVLSITIPKKAVAQPRRIQVN